MSCVLAVGLHVLGEEIGKRRGPLRGVVPLLLPKSLDFYENVFKIPDPVFHPVRNDKLINKKDPLSREGQDLFCVRFN
jgi:hypothetical protein